ncbi:MAG: polyribonucleotide nucleotidyltransferase, partial [Candidatus Omnitrophica bacterium]|nr:polyribonucleotide nucleotidyltransferase [Candidatus Omnitrophota bacterium]
LNGASAALSISDIPFDGPLACCRVGRLEGQFVVNPAYKELEQSDIDVIVAGSKKGILMLESGCKEVSEEDYHAAVAFGFEKLQDIISLQEKFVAECGKAKTEEGIVFKKIDPALYQKIDEMAAGRLNKVYEKSGKEEREEEMSLISKDLEEALVPEGYLPQDISAGLRELEKVQVRNRIVKENTRVDGRSFTEIRPISCAAAVLPRTHGSSLFTRGQTQSLAVTTLGTGEDEQLIEALEGEQYKRFMLHYNFPPFSVGETGPIRGPGRREIGHGALAERSLLPVMPGKEQFPYTIRVVSEILESNGSSSMATVCAASLALMDAGVPITSPVGGVALGLVTGEGEARILTDIAGVEDFFGDMDFKVAGT